MRVSLKNIYRIAFFSLAMACAPIFAYADELAGTVLIVIGEANLSNAAGQSSQITRGEKIYAGQIVTTGANGHVNLRMIDGASVIVRASSRLRIEEYHVDTENPSKSRIKLNLESGVIRSITGRAGDASKDSYRLNTPLAAIGIRGTDFVVQANNDVTRVLVQSGAIVMTPIGDDCTRDSLGPCRSASSRDLTAAMRDAYLELRGRNSTPVFVPASKALESPNIIAPPRQDEPRVGADKANKVSVIGSDAVLDASRNVTVSTIQTQVNATKPEVKPVIPVIPVVTVIPVVPVDPVKQVEVIVPAKIWWGRWESYATGSGLLTAVLTENREISSSNPMFGLVRESSINFVLPSSGVASFKLAGSESYLQNADKSLTNATISAPSLSIDFGNRLYSTSLTVNVADMSPIAIQSSGRITFQGYFVSELNSADTTVDGSLIGDGSQAGYLFQRFLSNGTSVVGATRWNR